MVYLHGSITFSQFLVSKSSIVLRPDLILRAKKVGGSYQKISPGITVLFR